MADVDEMAEGLERMHPDHNKIGTSGIIDQHIKDDTSAMTLEEMAADEKAYVGEIHPHLASPPEPPQPKRQLRSADVRKVRDLKTEEVHVAEWDGYITIKALTAKERDDFESSVLEKRGKTREFTNKNIRAKLVVKCAVDPVSFERMWSDVDAEWLGDKSAHAVNTLYEAAARLSGITEADASELEGNSKRGDGDASSSPSR